MLGVSLVLLGLIPLLQVAGVPERVAYTACGGALVVTLLLPWNLWDAVFGTLAMDFSTWIVAGLMIIVGAVLVMVHNAAALLALVMRVFGRIGRSHRFCGCRSRIPSPRGSAPERRSRCSPWSCSRS